MKSTRKQSGNVWWFLHTAATVNTDSASAVLERNGKKLFVRILRPTNARFEVMKPEPLPSSPHPPVQAKNGGVSKLAVHLPDGSACASGNSLKSKRDPAGRGAAAGSVVMPMLATLRVAGQACLLLRMASRRESCSAVDSGFGETTFVDAPGVDAIQVVVIRVNACTGCARGTTDDRAGSGAIIQTCARAPSGARTCS